MKLFLNTKIGILIFIFNIYYTHCTENNVLITLDNGSDNNDIDWSRKSSIISDSLYGQDKSKINLSGLSDNVTNILSALSFILLSACILQFIISKINDKIPISIVLFIFGMITYIVISLFNTHHISSPLVSSLTSIRNIDNSILYYIALPILLYEATQNINWYTFCNFLLGGISLAVVGVVIQVALLGVVFYYIIGSGWSLNISFLLASILSSTDPIAVLAVLGGVQSPNKLSPMFNSEALINDGTSVLLFQFFYLLVIGTSTSVYYHFMSLFKLLFLSPIFGLFVGLLVIVWISFFRCYHVYQCLSVIAVGYLIYFISEFRMNLSGPLTIVCYGVVIKAYGLVAFDREALDKHHNFVEGLANIANSSVFLISGILTIGLLNAQLILQNVQYKILKLFAVYICLNIARAIMIISFIPLLNYIGYPINYKEVILLIWGGLRGAMSLVLCLRIEADPNIDQPTTDMLGFYISGSVMLILIIQGLTFESLYCYLNPYPMKAFRQVYLIKVMKMIEIQYDNEIKSLESHWLFKNTNTIQHANKLVPILSNFTWNKIGKIIFHHNKNINECDIPIHMMIRYESDISELYVMDDELDIGMPLFKYSGIQGVNSSDVINYDPKLYLRLLEHVLTMDKNDSSSDDIINDIQSPKVDNNYPIRLDTDTTINLETYLNNSFYNEDEDDDIMKGKKILRVERQGELYIMIFNAFSYMYNDMYKMGYINGRSLLVLQKTLDISEDFAIKRLKQRSISAWSNVLNEYINDSNTFEFNNNLENMDGFEFEWFILKSLINGTSNNNNFFKIPNKLDIYSILEIIIAYVDVHTQLLERGGNNFKILLKSKLLASYKRHILLAKKHIFRIRLDNIELFNMGLLNIAACMMIRIKRDISNEHCANGFLLQEDRKQIDDLLNDQLYKISTRNNYFNAFKLSFNKKYKTNINERT